MTSYFVGLTIITFATVACTEPVLNPQFKPSLHERHNDDLYAENTENQSPNTYLENKNNNFRRFNIYPEEDSSSYPGFNSNTRSCEATIIKKINDLIFLFERILIEGTNLAKMLSKIFLTEDIKNNISKRKIKNHFFDQTSADML